MNALSDHVMFGILLSLAAFEGGLFLQKKTKLTLLNPLLLAVIVILLVLVIADIPLEHYQKGGDVIDLFLGPATVVLAVPLYQQLPVLKRHCVEIMIGIAVGVLVGLCSTGLMCLLFRFDPAITASVLPKSITTPIGIEVSRTLGGIPAVSVLTILVTGILGAIVSEWVFALFRIHHPVARGISLGSGAHAIGTSKALSLGKVEGAMSSLAIGLSALLTVFVAPFFWQVISAWL